MRVPFIGMKNKGVTQVGVQKVKSLLWAFEADISVALWDKMYNHFHILVSSGHQLETH